MTIYEFGLALGFLGLAIMAFSGLLGPRGSHDNDVSNVGLPGTHGGHGAGAGPGHAAAGPGAPVLPALGARAGGASGARVGGASGARVGGASGARVGGASGARVGGARVGLRGRVGGQMSRRLLGWLSPRVMFSVLVGFGAAGLALQHLVPEPWRALVALALGGLFEALMVGPMWRLVMSFGSEPARTLDQHLLSEARAETRFDANGQGLISIEVDGQVVQVLGTLRRDDREAHVRVRAGDRLIVEDVDAARNRCTVSRREG